MIGIRNRADDGLDLCTEVWINELRLNGLNEKGGAAALARLDLQLAAAALDGKSGYVDRAGEQLEDMQSFARQLPGKRRLQRPTGIDNGQKISLEAARQGLVVFKKAIGGFFLHVAGKP
ncbi:hypothetical protein [Desulfosarcina sp.]|uniref:hypothetical protein n=1 Tax=Desulfosarcina sp. TaxID=2027861 RepID=UPI003563861F